MKFRAHDTFFIRKGWLSKGLKNVKLNSSVFISHDINPMDTLGIGANMVKALRYWLTAAGLTEEQKKGKRGQILTPLGKLIYANDPYIEELGTLWLLHYRLATNLDEATAWYYFFNEFKLTEFTRDDFITQVNSFLRINGEEVSDRSVEDDYNCIINTYISRIKSNPEKVQPESNIDCPLGELGLIDIVNKRTKVYKKSSPQKNTLHPLILLAVILDQAENGKSIKISEIQNGSRNAGKIFNLDIIALTTLLYKIELLGYIKVIRTAGLDIITIETKLDFLGCVKEYYRCINDKSSWENIC
jgi:hypothetical protein